ncbi:MAG: hypothetical protein K2X47_08475 [Bdellovibrionales bacterium]|nr:hypothetical protein [Bdellovibrionales bacterium]
MMLPKFKRILGSVGLLTALLLNNGCGKVTFSAVPAAGEQGKGVKPDDSVNPGGNPPGGNPPGGNPPGGNPPGGLPPGGNPPPQGTARCGGPANPADYTGYSEIAKSQSRELFSSYAACTSARAAIFGNAMVCSKMVAATILGCLQTADYRNATMELDLALPILKATGRMETPYDYFLLGVPNCAIAASYINSNMGASIPTAGGFTSVRADVRAECVNTTDVVIHVLRIY